MRLANPSVLYFFAAILVMFLVLAFYERWQQKTIIKVMGARLWPFLTQSLSVGKRNIKILLQFIVMILIILSLARPQAGESQQEVKSEGVELLMLVDVSESMLAEDVKPNRLEQAKLEFAKLMDLMPGNKVGVVAFAGSAALLCPLTNDPNAVKMYLDSLTTDSVSSQGTNFEDALKTAAAAFERGGVGEGAKVTRVILIASDGEDHEPGALAQAEKLAEKGLRIFTIAYGTEKGGTIPQRDNMGYLRDFKKSRDGQAVITTVKGEALKKLAQAGSGSFYFANFGGSHLASLVEEFTKLDRAEFATQMTTQYDEKFQWILFLAVLIALLELFLGERKTGFKIWRGRYEVPR